MTNRERLIELIKERSFKKSDTPSFRLTSGKMSRYYFNLKGVTLIPEGQVLIGGLVFDKTEDLGLRPKAIGGLTMGADPIAVATSFTSFHRKRPIEAFVIRKEPKGHGMGLQIEGNVNRGDKVIIVDDVVTTGKSTVQAIRIAREHGLDILAAIVLLDRCEENGRQNVEAQGVALHAILSIEDFL